MTDVNYTQVLRHDYYNTMFHEFQDEQRKKKSPGTKPQVPKSISEVARKSYENDYSFGLIEYNFCLDTNSKYALLVTNTEDEQRRQTRQEVLSQVFQGQTRVL